MPELPASAELLFDDWAGRRGVRVIVIGETPKRYRICTQGPDPIRLAGRRRFLGVDESALVPKTAIRFITGADHAD